nr:antibiotic resistance protein VanZ [Hongsoonwoonella zoysiae]
MQQLGFRPTPWRLAPAVLLAVYGICMGLVFNAGFDHPYDKVQHILFFGLLTLAIHALFSCRLRVSAITVLILGLTGEAIQGVLPNHHASLLDAGANTIGIAVVAVTIALVRSEVKAAATGSTIADMPESQALSSSLSDR